jgi:hypothetical protein
MDTDKNEERGVPVGFLERGLVHEGAMATSADRELF